MINWIIGYYGLQILLIILIVIVSYVFWDKRYKNKKIKDIPDGFVKTEEMSIDPVNNEIQRVYYNPETGERIYVTEK